MEPAFFAPIVNFAIVMGILVVAGRKPIAELFSARTQTIGTAVKGAEAESTEASAVLAKAEKQHRELAAELARSHADATAFLAKYKEETLNAAAKESLRIAAEAKLIIENESQRAKQTLEKEISVKCIKLASDSLKSQVTEADQEKLTRDFTEGLPNGQA